VEGTSNQQGTLLCPTLSLAWSLLVYAVSLQGLTDVEQIQRRLAVAERGLSDLQSYSQAGKGGTFELKLKGACQ